MTQALLAQLDLPEPVIGLTLFGSRARGDQVAESDHDILVWCEGGHPRTIDSGMHSLAVYPRTFLVDLAINGDLFVSHLVHEGKGIWDPQDLLGSLRQAFVPKQSYANEIGNAQAIGLFLLQFHPRLPSALINRRIAWVVRTILIAKSAERGVPLFAAGPLAENLDAPEAMSLIALKNQTVFSYAGLLGLERFLARWTEPVPVTPRTIAGFRSLFRARGNEFGLKTLKSLRKPDQGEDYR